MPGTVSRSYEVKLYGRDNRLVWVSYHVSTSHEGAKMLAKYAFMAAGGRYENIYTENSRGEPLSYTVRDDFNI